VTLHFYKSLFPAEPNNLHYYHQINPKKSRKETETLKN
jgi:hypothetical protein